MLLFRIAAPFLNVLVEILEVDTHQDWQEDGNDGVRWRWNELYKLQEMQVMHFWRAIHWNWWRG